MPIIKLTTKKQFNEVDEMDFIRVLLEKMIEAMGQQKVLKLTDEVIKQIKGENGDKGEKGNKGEQGRKGDNGDKGEQGIQGKKGISGLDGLHGEKGENGNDGKSGKDAIDGSPDTAKDIATKLNTLKEKVDFSVIKGLDKTISGLRKLIQSKKSSSGGGMGNVIHDQFDGDGATVEFTLSNSVAGAGTAVYACRYEGQIQHLGDQYTISGKTLIFTFTPEDGTKIEITYSRSG